jgi:purine-binding chemotaxis protein CheW
LLRLRGQPPEPVRVPEPPPAAIVPVTTAIAPLPEIPVVLPPLRVVVPMPASLPDTRTSMALQTQARLRVLVFRLAGDEFVIDVAHVQEIVRPEHVVRVAGAPPWVDGVIKRRGRIVPIVNLAARVDLPPSPPSAETCAIIVRLPAGHAGLLVDAAVELLWIRTQDFAQPSAILADGAHPHVLGRAHLGRRFLTLLDVERLFSAGEQSSMTALAGSATPGNG